MTEEGTYFVKFKEDGDWEVALFYNLAKIRCWCILGNEEPQPEPHTIGPKVEFPS